MPYKIPSTNLQPIVRDFLTEVAKSLKGRVKETNIKLKGFGVLQITLKDEMAPVVPIPRILIDVSGGVVQEVYADGPIRYLIRDWDNIAEGDAERFLDDAKPKDDWGNVPLIKSPKEFDKESIDGVDEHLSNGNGKR